MQKIVYSLFLFLLNSLITDGVPINDINNITVLQPNFYMAYLILQSWP